MPAQSEVSICNLALTALSSSRIEALDQDNENARKCNAVYSFQRDNMLSQHNWNFALKEVSLAELSITITTGDWTHAWQLPSDCLRVVRQEDDFAYKIFEDRLFNNDSSCKIQYIARITDTQKFPAYFAKALASDIASILAYGITQNASLAEVVTKKAMLDYKEAIWSDSQEGQGNKSIQGDFLRSRQARFA